MPKISAGAASAEKGANDNTKDALEAGIAQAAVESAKEAADMQRRADEAVRATNEMLNSSAPAPEAAPEAAAPAAAQAPNSAAEWSKQVARLTENVKEQGKDRANLKRGWLPGIYWDNAHTLENGESRMPVAESTPQTTAAAGAPAARATTAAPEVVSVPPPSPEASDGMEHVRKLMQMLKDPDLKRFRAIIEDVHAGNPLPKNGYGFLSPQTERDMLAELQGMPEENFTQIREKILPEEETHRMHMEAVHEKEKKGFWRRIFGGSR